jgi:hypothetical protein
MGMQFTRFIRDVPSFFGAKSGADRRANTRHDVDLEVTIRYMGHAVAARITNLSSGGASVVSDEPLQKSTIVQIAFPQIARPVQGRVLRVGRESTGIQFERATDGVMLVNRFAVAS